MPTKDFLFRVLTSLVAFVLLFGAILLLWSIKQGFAEVKAVYQLVVVDTLIEPFVAIVAAFIAYIFGRQASEVLNNRNAMKNNVDPSNFPLKEV